VLVVGLSVLLTGAAHAERSAAVDRAGVSASRWTLAVSGVYSHQPGGRTGLPVFVGVAAGFEPIPWLECSLAARLGAARDLLQLDAYLSVSGRWRWRWLTLLPGMGLGFSATHQTVPRSTSSYYGVTAAASELWAEALLWRLSPAVVFSLASWLELRFDPAAFSLYISRFWISAWEPELALRYRF
jgi:hypothetical protein